MKTNKIQRLTITLVTLLMATASWAQYHVTVNAAVNGSVSADPVNAAQGTTIKLTATPSAGYYLEKLTIIPYASGDMGCSASFTDIRRIYRCN